VKSAYALLLSVAVLLLPGAAQACAVCGPGTEESRVAFIVTTGLLTALPLLTIGGVIWWLRGRFAEMEQRTKEAREAAIQTAGARS
jgi:quinol-cytochrome oxidoreductase complex cytochrome b subunit